MKEKWETGSMIGLSILAFLIPIAGWIIGGINLKHPERNGQAIWLIVLGVLGFGISINMLQ